MKVTWGRGFISFKKATIGDNMLKREFIISALSDEELLPGVAYRFGQWCAQMDECQDINWQPPEDPKNKESVLKSFQQWLELPGELGDLGIAAIRALNQPSDKATGPIPPPEDAEKN